MGKSKKPKKQVNLKPEFVLDPNAPQKHKKKKKNAPDRPQPEWMFPPDEENPVLNPKNKSQEQLDKEKADHDRVIKYLQYRSVSTPVKPPPPALLLTLVGAFLTSYGFNSTSRLYTTELSARKKLDEWKVLIDEKLPKGFPDLVKLFKVGQKTFEEQKASEETSSSESEDESDDETKRKSPRKGKASKQAASKAGQKGDVSSGESLASDDTSDSDVEMEDAPPATKMVMKAHKDPKRHASSSSSSSSDSDADDEQEPAGAPLTPEKGPVPLSGNNTDQDLKSNKHRASDSSTKVEVRGRGKPGAVELSSNEETSPEESDLEDISEAVNANLVTPAMISSSSDSESDSSDNESTSSSSGPDSPIPSKIPINPSIDAIAASGKTARQGSSSSETLKGASDQKPTTAETSISFSSSDPETSAPWHLKEAVGKNDPGTHKTKKSKKRKHSDESQEAPISKKQAHDQQKTNTPFERVPKDTPVDARFDNKYKSYDYADRAYQDLSVTKGKGFTKEKNKKKRGSYRGGAIDVTGGKGTKFED